AADPRAHPEAGTPWQIPKLYVVAQIDDGRWEALRPEFVAAGIDTTFLDRRRERPPAAGPGTAPVAPHPRPAPHGQPPAPPAARPPPTPPARALRPPSPRGPPPPRLPPGVLPAPTPACSSWRARGGFTPGADRDRGVKAR